LVRLHSFPTRRSSDLGRADRGLYRGRQATRHHERGRAPARPWPGAGEGLSAGAQTMGIPTIKTGPMTVDEFYEFTDRRPDEEKRSEEHTSELQSLAYL